ncbi:MAG: alpha/beta fold hydrolase [Gemmatimonadales bacterium]|nr:alpha/beta fold hydrolase [Gemmatimonadales bacterium]
MATPRRRAFALPGALGPVSMEVRAAPGMPALPAVVILHGFKGFKEWGFLPPFAERVARAGCTAVTLTVSGAGVDDQCSFSLPERFGHNSYGAELADLGLVLDALAAGELGVPAPTSIGLLGHSRGGGVAILRAATDARVRALVTWASIARADRWGEGAREAWRRRGRLDVVNARTGDVLPLYTTLLDELERDGAGRLDILAHAARLAVPWLVVHGTADEAVPFAEAEALVAAQPRARLLAMEGAGHGFGAAHPWTGSTPALDKLFVESVEWLSRHLT